MLVQRVLLPAARRESWTVLGDDGPVQPIERYLAYLTDIERSPNTVKAYAHDLKDWFVFLTRQGLDWREVRLEDVAGFVAWLRRPPAARDGSVAVLPSVEHYCGESTVNRKLSALSAFYQHAARSGVDLGELLVTWQPAGRRGTAWKPFLHHITKGELKPRTTVALKAPRKLPRVLTLAEMQAILDACDRLRDRFLFALLYETGMRIGEALGLRHEDLAAAERTVSVVSRDNDNGARSKSREPRSIPVSAELVRLYADYLHGEYGTWTATTCSSTCGASRAATRWPTRPSTIWCAGCAGGRAPASTRTGAGTPRRPGCCVTGCPSRSSPGCLAMRT